MIKIFFFSFHALFNSFKFKDLAISVEPVILVAAPVDKRRCGRLNRYNYQFVILSVTS